MTIRRGDPELVIHMRRLLGKPSTRKPHKLLSFRELEKATGIDRTTLSGWERMGPPPFAAATFAGVLLKKGKTREALELLEIFG